MYLEVSKGLKIILAKKIRGPKIIRNLRVFLVEKRKYILFRDVAL